MHHGILKALPLLALFASQVSTASAQRHDDIVEVARSAGQFSTLLTAVEAAGQSHTIAGKGPFTVFAHADDAFARLPEGTVESLLEQENLPKLAEILKYHVVSGRVYADQALEAGGANTLAGPPVRIRVSDGNLPVNDSKVTATDIQPSNGVVHVIDAVLLPPEVSPEEEAARELMSLAIERGVPLYNRGQAESCAAIHKVAVTALLQMGDAIPHGAQREIRSAIRASRRSHDMSDRAWMLRQALDETMRQMTRAMEGAEVGS